MKNRGNMLSCTFLFEKSLVNYRSPYIFFFLPEDFSDENHFVPLLKLMKLKLFPGDAALILWMMT